MTNTLHSTPSLHYVGSSEDAIDAIRTAAGVEEIHFNGYFRPMLGQYARFVQSLPLSRPAYPEINGAWHFGLTVSLLALRIASTKMFFPTLNSEERRALEPQCRLAAFVAALATGVALVTQNVSVCDAHGEEYHPLTSLGHLEDWLSTAKKPTFAWRATSEELTSQECAAIGAVFIPKAYFRQFDLRIPLMVVNSVAPKASASGIESTLSRVVRMAVEKAIELYGAKAKSVYSEPSLNAVPTTSEIVQAGTDILTAADTTPETNPLDEEPPSQSMAPSKDVDETPSGAPALLDTFSPMLKEWFQALTSHARYSEIRAKLTVTNDGIEIPVVMLGSFGINGQTVKTLMEEVGLVKGKSVNGRSLILSPTLKPVLFASRP